MPSRWKIHCRLREFDTFSYFAYHFYSVLASRFGIRMKLTVKMKRTQPKSSRGPRTRLPKENALRGRLKMALRPSRHLWRPRRRTRTRRKSRTSRMRRKSRTRKKRAREPGPRGRNRASPKHVYAFLNTSLLKIHLKYVTNDYLTTNISSLRHV